MEKIPQCLPHHNKLDVLEKTEKRKQQGFAVKS